MRDDEAHRSGRRGGRRWLLFGSLALNLFLIGFLAVGAVKHHHRSEDMPPRALREVVEFMADREDDGWRLMHHMSDADEAALRDMKREHGARMTQAVADVRAARAEIVDLIAAGERDPEVLQPAFDRVDAARGAFHDALVAILMDSSERLSDDGYTLLAGHPWERRRD
jgi:uncharacterized membrane protein